MIAGVCIISYPFVSDYFYNLRFKNVVRSYEQETAEIDDSETKEMLASARAFNKKLFAETGGNIKNLEEEMKEEYYTLLQTPKTGIMGYIRIDKINVALPIYHGTEESALQAGIGHLEGSSLPVGGTGTHTVLTGHSGLPSKKLFTDLDRLEEGDTFSISVLGETYTYEVDSTQIMLPEDVQLTIKRGTDEATLITCTPIGVNTHRLLVHAHRIKTPKKPETAKEDAPEQSEDLHSKSFLILFLFLAVLLAGIWTVKRIFKRKRRKGMK